jgi:flagellar biosynthetic protein FliR
MGTDLQFSLSTLIGFLLVFCRIAGVFVYIPIPGTRSGPDAARVVLSLCITLTLFPLWPKPPEPDLAKLIGWMAMEVGLGTAAGLVIGFFMEAFAFGAQMLSLQGGFSYASTIDPTTQAESTVLITMSQLAGGMLFFATGVDQRVLLSFAKSLETFPPASFTLGQPMAQQLIHLGSAMFTTGLRLVLPAIAFLIMVDVALALLSRINTQLQVISLAFPAKIMATVLMLASLALLLPRIFVKASQPLDEALRAVLQAGG